MTRNRVALPLSTNTLTAAGSVHPPTSKPALERQRTSPLWLRLSWWAACVSAAAFAVAVVWIVGHRGIYLYDESTVFDGGWRIVQGQVMYRDFYAPYGPVVYWLQGQFFRVLGVSFSSMVGNRFNSSQ